MPVTLTFTYTIVPENSSIKGYQDALKALVDSGVPTNTNVTWDGTTLKVVLSDANLINTVKRMLTPLAPVPVIGGGDAVPR